MELTICEAVFIAYQKANPEQAALLAVVRAEYRKNPKIVELVNRKYDGYLAKIRERPVSLDDLESALKDFETWKPEGPAN